mmetsp:Transcript_5279/g.7672  ORF Transcript_5279/g.7672 Transcript_5279/m.7672 type:complete len:637 (-) Transcript_5279:53-1963(-)
MEMRKNSVQHSNFIGGVRRAIGNVKPVLVAKAEAAAAASEQRQRAPKVQKERKPEAHSAPKVKKERKPEAAMNRRDVVVLPTDQAETAALCIQHAYRKTHPHEDPVKRGNSGKVTGLTLREQPDDEAAAARRIQRAFRRKSGRDNKGEKVSQASAPRAPAKRSSMMALPTTQPRVIITRDSSQDEAARLIQKRFRKNKAGKPQESDQAAAKITQTKFREQRQEFADAMGMKSSGEMQEAALRIQKRFRGNKSRRLQSVMSANVELEQGLEGEQSDKEHADAARSIQRMFRNRRNLIRQKEQQIAAKRIQRSFRKKKQSVRQAQPGSAEPQADGDPQRGLLSLPDAPSVLQRDSFALSGPLRKRGAMIVVQDSKAASPQDMKVAEDPVTPRRRLQPDRRRGLLEKSKLEGEDESPGDFGKHSRSMSPGHSVSTALSMPQQSARRQKLAARAAERAALREEHALRVKEKAQKKGVSHTPAYSTEIVKRQRADEDPPDFLELSSLQPCLRKVLMKRILPPVGGPEHGKRRPAPSGVIPLRARSLPGPAEGVLRRLADQYRELKSVPVDPLTPRSPLLRPEESRLSPRSSSVGAKALLSPTEASIACLTARLLVGGGSCGGSHVGISSFRPCWMTQQHRY